MEDKFHPQRIEWYIPTKNVNCVGFLLRFPRDKVHIYK